ncbi:MAG: hypothetical protein KatS3mg115_2649 [Candidatus Poribacteria bacterium]|nr:MAG: hypothetical protein KatS3mg115_2649 [Candidatus Poribacteria bacterium]
MAVPFPLEGPLFRSPESIGRFVGAYKDRSLSPFGD